MLFKNKIKVKAMARSLINVFVHMQLLGRREAGCCWRALLSPVEVAFYGSVEQVASMCSL